PILGRSAAPSLTLPFTTPLPTASCSLSLHAALPIWAKKRLPGRRSRRKWRRGQESWSRIRHCRTRTTSRNRRRSRSREVVRVRQDRKSTRLNSSHEWISYAVFCLKKKREERQGGGRR